MADQPLLQPYVIIDGVKASMTKQDMLAGLPTVKDGLQFDWGRDKIVDQPDSPPVSFVIRQRIGLSDQSIFDACTTGKQVQIWASGSDEYALPDRLVWAGEISTAMVQPTDPYALEAQVTCVDASVTLGNITIGDEQWPEEAAYDRFQRMLTAAGLRTNTLRPDGADWWTLTADMDEMIRSPRVAFRDINPQTALSLFQELAESLGAVAWITADASGRYMWLEDPKQRKGLRQFTIDAGTGQVSIGQLSLDLGGVNEWPAVDIIPGDPIWTRDPSQSINLVDINWLQAAGVDDQGVPQYTDKKVEIADSTVAGGIRSLTKDTQLVNDADARRLAAHWMAQTQTGNWTISGLRLDSGQLVRRADAATRLVQAMDLLDCKTRIGCRITVTGLPTYAPSETQQSYYVDGGSYAWADNRWQLQLTAFPNAIGGGAKFNQFPPGTKITDFAGLKGRDVWGAAAPNLVAMTVPFSIPTRVVG